MSQDSDRQNQTGRGVAVAPAHAETKRPSLFRVLLINDDFTPMDFVVDVLRSFFAMDTERAVQIMLHVHTRGRGVCGVFTREVAEMRVHQVNAYARTHQHPLLCTMEKV